MNLTETAILLVDPYNDFLSAGGKAWPKVGAVATKVGLVEHLRAIVEAARGRGVRIFFVPHHRCSPGDFDAWQFPTPYQKATADKLMFEKGTWGGSFHDSFQPQPDDIVVSEHRSSSGFANTDLDLLLRQHAVRRVVLIGMIANTCIEATGRYAQELGYHVTLVKDATAAFSDEAMHAAHEINGPTYAHDILTTAEVLERLAA